MLLAPVLLALFPILALHSFNIEYVHYSAVLRSIAWTLIGTSVVFGFAFLFTRKLNLASAITSLFVILFFSYGHVYLLLSETLGWTPPNLALSATWLILFIAGTAFLIARRMDTAVLSRFILIFAGVLIVFNLARILSFENAKRQANLVSLQKTEAQITGTGIQAAGYVPDIYYIVLDAHARADVLQDRFGYDNSAFINGLEDIGFFVADCSQANYWRTEFSVGSTFRMQYFGEEFTEADALPDWQFSETFQLLRSLGYQVVTFESRAIHNQDLGADTLLSRRSQVLIYENIYPFTNLNDFEANLLKTTWLQSWLQLLANYAKALPESLVLDADNSAYLEHYRQTLYTLDELPRVPYLSGPKFVYVHLLLPHEPFIFDASGRFQYRHTRDEFEEGYRNNVEFIDTRLPAILAQIIENSVAPPIIIVQGDHGPNGSPPETLLPILNAYYFPGVDEPGFYESISPVNSYRLFFSQYFGLDYPLLEDLSFYARGTNLAEAELAGRYCGE